MHYAACNAEEDRTESGDRTAQGDHQHEAGTEFGRGSHSSDDEKHHAGDHRQREHETDDEERLVRRDRLIDSSDGLLVFTLADDAIQMNGVGRVELELQTAGCGKRTMTRRVGLNISYFEPSARGWNSY